MTIYIYIYIAYSPAMTKHLILRSAQLGNINGKPHVN